MALNDDTEALLLAYVYGELSASDARDFERRMDAGTPEAAELRAEVEGMRASRELFGKDAAFGLRTGVDVPPAHLVDAIMNAEKLARLPAVRDAALARVAPPVDKSFTAKLSRWLLGGGVAVGAAAALFIVVTQGAQEPALQSESIAAKDSAAVDSAVVDSAAVVDAPKAEMAPPPAEAPPSPDASPNAPLGGAFADNAKLGDVATVAEEKLSDDRLADKLGGEARNGAADVAGADDGFASAPAERGLALEGANKPARTVATPMVAKPRDFEEEPAPANDAPAQDPAMRSARGRADDAKKKPAYKGDSHRADADTGDAQDEAKREENRVKLDELSAAKTKAKQEAKDFARQPAKESPKEPTKSRDSTRGDDFSFESAIAPAKGAKAEKKADTTADKKAEEKPITMRESEKAGMRSSVGADKDLRGGGGLGLGASGGVAIGAASSGSGPGAAPRTTTTSPTAPAATAPAATVPMSPPPPPAPLAKVPPKPNAVADAKPAPSEADDEESSGSAGAPKKVISREALEEQRKNVRKKSVGGGATGKSVAADTERAKRLEQANIALASAQREMAAKRWLSAFDQMALAESLDFDRALGATPLVGQMRALVALKRPIDAGRVARRLGRWDVKAFDVVPGLLLGAQVAEQIGDERLARELWTRLLEVPSEKAKARAALDRMEGAKALRRQQYDSDAAEAPAAAAPEPSSESAKE